MSDTGKKNEDAALPGRHRVAAWVFRCLAKRKSPYGAGYEEVLFEKEFADSAEFFRRFEGHVNPAGRSVLDIGCGYGGLNIFAALNGSTRSVGVDTDEARIACAKNQLATHYPKLSGKVVFETDAANVKEKFDLVFSRNAFEHFSDPLGFLKSASGWLKPGGCIAIGFGPLWKSPYGGHIDYMTKLPWAHLLFPAEVILAERRRYIDDGKTDEEVCALLNYMTVQKFHEVIRSSGLQFRFLRTNATGRKGAALVRFLSRAPMLREYFTMNIYTVLAPRGAAQVI